MMWNIWNLLLWLLWFIWIFLLWLEFFSYIKQLDKKPNSLSCSIAAKFCFKKLKKKKEQNIKNGK